MSFSSKRFIALCYPSSLAFPGTVALGYLSNFLNRGFRPFDHRAAWCLVFGAIYSVLGAVDYTALRLNTRRPTRAAFLALQASLLFGIFWTSRLSGQIWLCAFPLEAVVVAMMPLAIALVGVAGIFVMTCAMASHFYGDGSLVSFSISMAPAFVFVVIFTQIAVREKTARARAEALSEEVEKLAVVKERNRLAHEIHDSLGHFLTTIHVQLEAAQVIYAADSKAALDAVGKAKNLAREALIEVRRSVQALQDDRSPPPLAGRLRELAEATDGWGAAVSLEILGEARTLSPEAEHILYRTAQEGLTNVRKHAQARTARVTLDYRDIRRVAVCVADDGRGMAAGPPGRGLTGLRERITALDGKVSAESSSGGGFRLQAELPA